MAYLIPPRSFSQPIDYRSPVNMRPEWEHLFKPDSAYQKVKLGARLLQNVFVNHYGLVINNGLLVKGCAPNIGHFPYDDENFYWPHWKKAMEQMLVARFGKSIPNWRLDDNRLYLLIHSPWFSYYFWVTECLPRLLMVKEHHQSLTLIYPESWRKCAFVNETLALFPDLDRVEVPSDVHLWVKNLVMPEVKPWTPMFIPEYVRQVRELILPAETSLSVPTKKICISRMGSFRSFENVQEVLKIINKYEFEVVKMEEFGFFDQVKKMNEAYCVMGISGAGHTNIHWMQKDANFLDITAKMNLDTGKYKVHFYKLAQIIGVNYFFQVAHNVPKDNVPYYNQNIDFDKTEFEQNISKMCNYGKGE